MRLPVFNELASVFDYCEVIPVDIPPVGQLVRVPTYAHRRGKSGYIRAFPDGAVFVGNWENGLEAIYSERSNRRLSRMERETIWHESAQQKLEAERAQKKAREGLFRRLSALLDGDKGIYPAICLERLGRPIHPYLKRKGISGTENIFECTREDFEAFFGSDYQRLPDGRLLVFPLVRAGAGLVSAQFIDERGNKYFLKNGETKGAYWIPTIGPLEQGAPFRVHMAEGAATLLSVLRHSRQGAGMFVSRMTAGNIKPVAKAIRERYPRSEIVMYADVDKPREGHRYGVGIEKAREAQQAVPNMTVLAPPFTESDARIFQKITRSDKAPTDWNDYYRIWEVRQ